MVMVGTVQAASQSYQATEKLTAGTLVSVAPDGRIQAATSDNAAQLLGVVVDAGQVPLDVVSGENQTQVTSSDTVTVQVSTLNGDIKSGDRIAPSFVTGIGAKATQAGRVVGVAQADFAAASTGATKQSLKLQDGTTKEVAVGRIPVQVQVVDYVPPVADENKVVPEFIQNLSNQVAGKEVPPTRIIASAVILIVSIITVSILLYGATRSSIISIGRNPLSRAAVERSLIQVIVLVLLVLAVAMGGVYGILKG